MSERRRAALLEGVKHFVRTGITPAELLYFLSDRMYWVFYVHEKKPDKNTGNTLWALNVLMERVAIPWIEGKVPEEALAYGFFNVNCEIGGEGLRECLCHVAKAYMYECTEDAFVPVKAMKALIPAFCALSNVCVCLDGYDDIYFEEKGIERVD